MRKRNVAHGRLRPSRHPRQRAIRTGQPREVQARLRAPAGLVGRGVFGGDEFAPDADVVDVAHLGGHRIQQRRRFAQQSRPLRLVGESLDVQRAGELNRHPGIATIASREAALEFHDWYDQFRSLRDPPLARDRHCEPGRRAAQDSLVVRGLGAQLSPRFQRGSLHSFRRGVVPLQISRRSQGGARPERQGIPLLGFDTPLGPELLQVPDDFTGNVLRRRVIALRLRSVRRTFWRARLAADLVLAMI